MLDQLALGVVTAFLILSAAVAVIGLVGAWLFHGDERTEIQSERRSPSRVWRRCISP